MCVCVCVLTCAREERVCVRALTCARAQPWHSDAKSARRDSDDKVRSAGRRIAEVVNGPNVLPSLVCCHYSEEDEDGVLH